MAAIAVAQSRSKAAAELGISLNTAKFHLKNVYSKLAVRNSEEAIAEFMRRECAAGAEDPSA